MQCNKCMMIGDERSFSQNEDVCDNCYAPLPLALVQRSVLVQEHQTYAVALPDNWDEMEDCEQDEYLMSNGQHVGTRYEQIEDDELRSEIVYRIERGDEGA